VKRPRPTLKSRVRTLSQPGHVLLRLEPNDSRAAEADLLDVGVIYHIDTNVRWTATRERRSLFT
jgi:hypothetical protein